MQIVSGSFAATYRWEQKSKKLAVFHPRALFFFEFIPTNVAFFNEAVFSIAIHFWCDLCGVSIVSKAMPSGESHPKYDKNFRALLEANIKTEIRLHNIAIDIEVSKSFVYQMRLHINTFNSIKAASFYATI